MNYQEIQHVLQTGLKTFRAFEKAEETISALVSLEQNKNELDAQATALRAEVEAAKAELLKARDQAKDVLAKAQVKADHIVGEASARASKVLGDAEEKAKAVEAAAQAEAEKAQADVQASMQAALDADAKVAELKAEAEKLEDRITKAKAQVAKLLG